MAPLRHLLQRPFDRPAEQGAYRFAETATLPKDLEKLLTPYGLRPGQDTVRHSECLGTEVLSPQRSATPSASCSGACRAGS